MAETSNQYSSDLESPMSPDPIDVNFNIGEPVGRITYKTPYDNFLHIWTILFFIFGFGGSGLLFLIYYTLQNVELYACFFPLIFLLACFFIGSFMSPYRAIDIDNTSGTVTLSTKKVFCCFNQNKKIKINEIRHVVVKTDPKVTYQISGVNYNSFEVIFILSNGKQVKGCSEVLDKNNEGRNCFSIIKKALPPKVTFSGNLTS